MTPLDPKRRNEASSAARLLSACTQSEKPTAGEINDNGLIRTVQGSQILFRLRVSVANLNTSHQPNFMRDSNIDYKVDKSLVINMSDEEMGCWEGRMPHYEL